MKILKENKKLLLILLLTITVGFISLGITLAFFNYVKQGDKSNKIELGGLTFYYDESKGTAFSITDAMPIGDSVGKVQTNKYVFSVKSNTTTKSKISYKVSLRTLNNDLSDYLKVYLTSTDNSGINYTINQDESINAFNDLNDIGGNVNVPQGYSEKLMYSGEVPSETSNYNNSFEFRMWLTDGLDFSPYEYVLTTAIKENGDYITDGLSPETLRSVPGTILTSKEYYSLSETDKLLYEKIAWIDLVNKKVLTKGQADSLADTTSYTKAEQYYPYNNIDITATINVYATGKDKNDTTAEIITDSSNLPYTTSHNPNVHSVSDALDDLFDIYGA